MIDCFVKSVASFQIFFYYRPMFLTLHQYLQLQFQWIIQFNCLKQLSEVLPNFLFSLNLIFSKNITGIKWGVSSIDKLRTVQLWCTVQIWCTMQIIWHKSLTLQIAALDYFLANRFTNTFSILWAHEAILRN